MINKQWWSVWFWRRTARSMSQVHFKQCCSRQRYIRNLRCLSQKSWDTACCDSCTQENTPLLKICCTPKLQTEWLNNAINIIWSIDQIKICCTPKLQTEWMENNPRLSWSLHYVYLLRASEYKPQNFCELLRTWCHLSRMKGRVQIARRAISATCCNAAQLSIPDFSLSGGCFPIFLSMFNQIYQNLYDV